MNVLMGQIGIDYSKLTKEEQMTLLRVFNKSSMLKPVSYTHLPRQAAEKLIHDFGLDPDKPPANAIALLPPKRGLTDEQWADIAYLSLIHI